MNESKFQMFENRLAKVWKHRSKIAARTETGCFRVYDHDLPEFPLAIEVYEKKLYVAEYKRRHGMTEEEHEQWLDHSLNTITEVTGFSRDDIFVKTRMRKAGRQGQYRKVDQTKNEFIVEENGLKFIVNLADYLDTGLFLDHRKTREKLKGLAAGKTVLNLFAYTGSFSVYAAAGNAQRVITVDLSRTYLDWARRNMELNGYSDADRYRYIQTDVLQFLKNMEAENYDIIILDPPTFSNSQRMEKILDIQQDHVWMINECLRGLRPGGKIFFSTNFREFRMEPEKLATTAVKDITAATTSFDFEGKFSRSCWEIG